VAAQDVRDKVAIAVRNMPREILPPDHRQVRQRPGPGRHDRPVQRPLAARADRDRPTRSFARSWSGRAASARSGSSAACRAPSTSGSIPIGWRPTRSRSRTCATRSFARTPTCQAAT
jgi:hypothetical protein